MWDISKLKPYEKNSRTHSPEQIAKVAASIIEYGFTNPILIDENSGILAGHGRLAASKQLQLKEVPVIVLTGLTEAQKKAYVIADNKLAEEAGWDNKLLAEELLWIKDNSDITKAGYSDEELDDLLASLNEAPPEEEPIQESTGEDAPEDDVPDIDQTKTVSKPGQIWKLGRHRIICGDSCNAQDIKKLMGGKLADLILTDPPYNVAYEGGTGLTIKNDSMGDTEFGKFLKNAYARMYESSKETASALVWFADSETANFIDSMQAVGFTVADTLIWKKSSLVLGRSDYHYIHEPCLYAFKQDKHIKPLHLSETVYRFDKPSKSAQHPTMKPVALFKAQIEQMTKPSDIVLDLFTGSGTTVIACEETNRIAYGCELDPKYCDVIVKRWQDFTGQDAVDAETGKTYKDLSKE